MGLNARNVRAWGEAPGERHRLNRSALKGRDTRGGELWVIQREHWRTPKAGARSNWPEIREASWTAPVQDASRISGQFERAPAFGVRQCSLCITHNSPPLVSRPFRAERFNR